MQEGNLISRDPTQILRNSLLRPQEAFLRAGDLVFILPRPNKSVGHNTEALLRLILYSFKKFETADIPPSIRPGRLDLQDDGTVHIEWDPDIPGFEDHMSIYDPSFGQRNSNLQSRLEATSNLQDQRIPWDWKTVASNLKTIDYKSYMTSSSTLLSSLQQLFRYGLLFIHSIPPNPDSVRHIGERIGPLKETLYNSTWDVKSVPSAKNVAYTSSHLGFHMDLLYVDNPPGLQILHCLRASTQGGESLFSDALRAVTRIQHSRPDHYSILKGFPVTYKYHNNREWYQQTRPHIEVVTSPHEDPKDTFELHPERLRLPHSIKAINWSPPFQAPFLVDIGENNAKSGFPRYFRAIRRLKKELEADEAVFVQRMKPGTAVIFDNRRIVHARRAFEDRGGERWLRGAYVDTDVFRSRLRVLREEAT
ncbi:MAG: hypothetical protein Q9170_000374 [Blastenia crenularia]